MREEEKEKVPFTELNLDESIIFSLFMQKYFFCVNIQKNAIPNIIKEENVLLHSETGSGKTLCFVIPILQYLVSCKRRYINKHHSELYVENNKDIGSNVLYNKDSMQSIYDYFENVDIQKCSSYVHIDIDNFIMYNNNIIQKEILREVIEQDGGTRGEEAKKDPVVGPTAGKVAGPVVGPIEGPVVDPVAGPVVGPVTGPVVDPVEDPITAANYSIIECAQEGIKNNLCSFEQKVKKHEGLNVSGIVITPTRELCIQIYNVINKFLFFIRLYYAQKFHIDFKTLNKENFFINVLLLRGAIKIQEDLKIIENEKKKKNRYQIIVGTPGKLSVLFNEYNNSRHISGSRSSGNSRSNGSLFDTSKLKYLILDEGDKLLEESYISYVKDIIKNVVQKEYCTCICSATCLHEEKFYNMFSNKVKYFTKCINSKSSTINVNADANIHDYSNENASNTFQLPEKIENYYYVLRNLDKSFFLFKFLNTVVNSGENIIIFFSTCFCVEFYFHLFKNILTIKKNNRKEYFEKIRSLNKRYNNIYKENELDQFAKIICYIEKYIGNKKKFTLLKIHRKMKDKKRIGAYKKIMENKNKFTTKVIFCTDIMSRGINVNVHWVLNYDVANKNMTYIHRSGRTGRFDKKGKSIVLLNKKEKEYIYFLKNKKVHIVNFKKTDMFQIMFNYELRMMKYENILSKEALDISRKNKKNITTLDKNENFFFHFYQNYYGEQFMGGNINADKKVGRGKKKNCTDEGSSSSSCSNNDNKNNDNNNDVCSKRDSNDADKKCESTEKRNIILLNNMVTLFLKYLVFFVIEYREIFSLSTKAFLSYIEFYRNHQLNFIFSLNKINLKHLCYAFALVKLPKFKEKFKIKNFQKININTFDIPYKNEEKEKKRQENRKNKVKGDLKNKEKEGDLECKKYSNFQQKEQNTIKNKKKQKMKKKKQKKTTVQRKREKRQMEEDEIDDLFFEEKLYKKLKKKKITKDEYYKLLNIDNVDNIFSTANMSKNVSIQKKNIFKPTKIKCKKKQKVFNRKIKKGRYKGKRK
ncbi:ATP-dependent rRNA helicase SPB4, putative [Plasmodium malariae]|uniref:ATP-dependent RNA helicase n=1 Tax=Plasmodium malariae TaxID=5858 RepID=A0A1A8W9F2_PLAMA|nr:ATP-dependent rRNA helicase SPB4, putative [Plasmodium malariae]SBS89655.1 ATP-dependent RNA helicase, putative [Plasmodium malariae]SCP02751.1 ATP-dependent rRNA helicase SPB4, putative [Plasmodium malariae]